MFSDTTVYLWGAYGMALALFGVEIALLVLRERSIFSYLRGDHAPVLS